jgi:hypothetical protein
MAFDWLGGDRVVIVPKGILDDTEKDAVGYWNQEASKANNNPNLENIHIIEATDVENAREQLETYSKNNPVSDLVFAGHGQQGTQRIGPISGDPEKNSLTTDAEINSFFKKINISSNPNIELQGCHTGESPGSHGGSLAERMSKLLNATIVAPTGDTYYTKWLTIFGWQYGYESGPTVKFANGVEE